MDYSEFLTAKLDHGAMSGFEPSFMPDFLFDFQKSLVDWSVRKGRAAIFADCGLGKTPMQLVWSQNVVQRTNKPVLILTPLSVSLQTLREAEKFGIEAHRASPSSNPVGIQVTNYEQLHKFTATDYGGVVCDESSILKNFDGKYKGEITEFMRQVPYRLLATATAAPNDWDELGTSSEALGYLGYMDMLKRFFTNDSHTSTTRRRSRFFQSDGDMRLKGHAETPFWRWVASWARAARKPSDLGFDDNGFRLPELIEQHTEVEASMPRQGMLFDVEAVNFFEEREVNRRTIKDRCEAVAAKVAQHDVSIVWCHLNDEAAMLKSMIPNSVEVSGKDSDDKKEDAVKWFVESTEPRVLISKPKIFGFGLNFQHCNHATYFPSHSYEQYYQAVRRLWRFGQSRPVTIDLIDTKGGQRVRENLLKKSRAADEMFANMVSHMNDALNIEKQNQTTGRVVVPAWL